MTTAPATPVVSRRSTLPWIWVVPILALFIAGWMVAKQFGNRGPVITIEFSSGDGIEAGKTQLEHKGVIVGVVKEVTLKKDMSGVLVRIGLTKAGGVLARAGSQFWAVHPEVSFSGVRGLETLMTGVRLNVRPGSGPVTKEFRGLDRPPPIDDPSIGRAFVLRTDKLGGISPGDPVYYRDVKIGIVETTSLSDRAIDALARVRIYNPYVPLVRTNSVFWNASGFSLKVGIHGAEMRTSTLQSLIAGGVSLGTPDVQPLAPPALENTEFELRDEPDKEWLKWRPRIAINPVESTPENPRPDSGGTVPAAAALMPAEKR